jgi:ParB-like chromosome segregation protein Spo0J
VTALKVHPAADLFPMMGETELAELAADIAASGQREPIAITPKDEVLDGRNRLAACKIAKVTPITKLVETDDPVAYVVSLNVKRRNLTVGQRAIAAAESWPMFGGPPK